MGMVRRFFQGIIHKRQRREAKQALAILKKYLSARVAPQQHVRAVEIEFDDTISIVSIVELARSRRPGVRVYI